MEGKFVTPPLTTSQQFQMEWSRFHGAELPLGWKLRHDEDRPWIRFHALPLSKRYAQDEAERSTILFRANSLGEQVLGSGTPCWIVETRYDECEVAGDLWMASAEDDDPDSPLCYFYVRTEEWQSGKYDTKLMDIADDRPNRAIWMRRDTGAVFAPYDGGFDLFPLTWQEVDVMRSARHDWLSSHPSGL